MHTIISQYFIISGHLLGIYLQYKYTQHIYVTPPPAPQKGGAYI